jgi:hypothetical protein
MSRYQQYGIDCIDVDKARERERYERAGEGR